MALRAVLKGPAEVRRVEMAAEIDRMIVHSAVRLVPVIHMTFRAGGLSEGAALEAIAVACGAMEVWLAVARRVKIAAEIHVMSRSGGHTRSALTCAHRIVRIPAARRRKGEEDGYDNGTERFPVHNSSQYAQHA